MNGLLCKYAATVGQCSSGCLEWRLCHTHTEPAAGPGNDNSGEEECNVKIKNMT